MKKIIKTASWLIILMVSVSSLLAQTPDQIEREIRIAEGILEELFEHSESEFTLRGGNVAGVSGRYIPEYGIHFRIGSHIRPEAVRVRITGHAQMERADEPDPEQIEEQNRQYIEKRFMEYLKTYAPLLRGLPEDEVVRLTFGVGSPVRSVIFHLPNSNMQRHNIPKMSAWTSFSNINAYSNGSLSESDFESRVQIQNMEDQDLVRDQEVFSSILETALKSADTDNFRILRKPETEYLQDLGLHYHIRASLRNHHLFGEGLEELDIKFDSLAINLSRVLEEVGQNLTPMAVRIDSMFNPDKYRGETDSLIHIYQDSLRKSAQSLRSNLKEQNLSDETVRSEVETIHRELIETVKEYGSTLKSLNNNEMLIITIHWTGRHPALPRRSELFIRKSEIQSGTVPEITVIEQ